MNNDEFLAQNDAVASPPPGRGRTIVSIIISIYVVFQILTPISYYLSSDTYDERFAWRMFSATRYRPCTARTYPMFEISRYSKIQRELPPIFISPKSNLRAYKTLDTGFIEKYLSNMCKQDERVSNIEYTLSCASIDETKPATHRSVAYDCRTNVYGNVK